MDIHPLADLLPHMLSDEYQRFKADIAANGVKIPVTLYEGKILDGRHRWKACEDLSMQCPTVTHEGDDASAMRLALSLNNRRNHTPGQLAIIAQSFEKYESEKAKDRQRLSPGARSPERIGNITKFEATDYAKGKERIPYLSSAEKGQSRDKAAAIVGVNPRYVSDAKKLSDKSPDLAAKVFAGETSLPAAMRQMRENENKEALQKPAPPQIPAGLYHGDFRECAKAIADESIELIFTDPPYDRDSIPLFADLAEIAARVLKPGGSLVAYCGQIQLPEVLESMRKHLRYWWVNACVHSGGATQMNKYGIKNKWKPIVWFVKGTRGDVQTFVDDSISGGKEKEFHEWQQSESEAAYYIEKLCSPGGYVWQPFAGGGTTVAACKNLGRNWIASDQYAHNVEKIAERLIV